MKIDKKIFGTLSDGRDVALFTLAVGDISFSLMEYGGTWTSIILPSSCGKRGDILLGYSDFSSWLQDTIFMNATIGRFSNRISGAEFSLDGQKYILEKDSNGNCLHSGSCAFNKLLWKGEAFEQNGGAFVRLHLKSPDGDGGFPGNVDAVVTYGLCDNIISANYFVKVDKNCPLSLTNHGYFNLAGKGNVANHTIKIYSSCYAPLNNTNIPTGELLNVDGTLFDFRQTKTMLQNNLGYDTPFSIDGKNLRPVADVFEPDSGRSLKLSSTLPAVQFYTGNNINNIKGRNGVVYNKHDAFCLETQYFPDSPNKAQFPSAIFGPERTYDEQALFEFNF